MRNSLFNNCRKKLGLLSGPSKEIYSNYKGTTYSGEWEAQKADIGKLLMTTATNGIQGFTRVTPLYARTDRLYRAALELLEDGYITHLPQPPPGQKR